MNGYDVEFSRRANEDLQTLSADVAVRIGRKIQELRASPHPRGDTIKRLQEIEIPTYRLRVGDYRVIFQIVGRAVELLRIVHRSRLDLALRDLV